MVTSVTAVATLSDLYCGKFGIQCPENGLTVMMHEIWVFSGIPHYLQLYVFGGYRTDAF